MALSKIFVAPKNGQGGVKKSKKKNSEKIFERWKKNLGTSGTIFAKNRFFEIRGSGGGGVRPTVTSLRAAAVVALCPEGWLPWWRTSSKGGCLCSALPLREVSVERTPPPPDPPSDPLISKNQFFFQNGPRGPKIFFFHLSNIFSEKINFF